MTMYMCKIPPVWWKHLVQANKQFDWAIYPDKNHGIYGGNTRLHLYTKMTNFINRTYNLIINNNN